MKNLISTFNQALTKRDSRLETYGFYGEKENLVFIGNPGVGKTHLVIALGIEACHQGYRTLFISCHELLLRLRSAFEKGPSIVF